MDIMEILQEAKKPTNRTITVEAPDSTDYTDELEDKPAGNDEPEETEDDTDTNTETEDDNDDGGTDYTEDTVDADDESTDSETTDDDTSDDSSETNDYTEDAMDDTESGDDDGGADQTEGDTESTQPQDPDAKKNAELLKSIIDLYYNIKETLAKLDKISNTNSYINQIIIQAKKNFNKLIKLVYTLIVDKYPGNTYVQNLYFYNYFIEAYKVNIELLRKISSFQ